MAGDELFDFRTRSAFTAGYLDTFYRDRPPTSDERLVLRFLVDQLRGAPPAAAAIEIGCGPTVHHALPLADYAAAIHMADYLPENLAEVERWRRAADGAMDWSRYTRLVLELEGRPADDDAVRRREAAVRARIARLVHCDLQRDAILDDPAVYPLVGAFYCTEEVGVTMAGWERVMTNLSRIVAPGGRLLLACLRDTEEYLVGEAMYPCARIVEEDVVRMLERLDFDMARSVVEAEAIAGQEHEGVMGVVLASAVRREG